MQSGRDASDAASKPKMADKPHHVMAESGSTLGFGRTGRALTAAWGAVSRKGVLIFVTVLMASILIWHFAVVVFNIESFILPTPLDVGRTAYENRTDLLRHSLATANGMAIGFVIAAAGGVMLAALMHYFQILSKIISPLIVSFQTIPKVALAPLFVVWFGFGILPRVMVAAAIAFFPIVIDTMVGLRSVKPSAIELARSMGGSRWQVFRKVELPGAMPSIFGGLKVASTLVVIGAVVGEYIVSSEGLGYFQLRAAYRLDSSLVFVSIILMSALGLLAYELISWLERIVMPWRRQH